MRLFEELKVFNRFITWKDKAALLVVFVLPPMFICHGWHKPNTPKLFFVIGPLALLACAISACAYAYALHGEAKKKEAALGGALPENGST